MTGRDFICLGCELAGLAVVVVFLVAWGIRPPGVSESEREDSCTKH